MAHQFRDTCARTTLLATISLLVGVANAGPQPVVDPYAPYETPPVPQAAPAESESSQRPLGETPEHERAPLGDAENDGSSAPPPSLGVDIARTAGSLAIVIGLILALRVGVKRLAGSGRALSGQLGAGGRAPAGILSVIGRYPIARGQTLVLLKVDTRILLLSQTGDGFRTLAQITEADEVASILTKARDEEGESMASRFTNLLRQAERDPRLADGDLVNVDEPRVRGGGRRPSTSRDEGDLGVESWDEAAGEGVRAGGDAVGALRRRLAFLTEGGR